MADSATRLEHKLLAAFSPYYIADVPSVDLVPEYNSRRTTEQARPPCRQCEHKTPAHALSITTRGLGLSTCNLCYIAATTAGFTPPIYAMYRAFLGLAEAKLATCPYLIGEPKANNAYDFKVKLYMLERAQTVPIVPEPIKRIIDAIDVITLNDKRYVPVLAGQLKDEEGELIPRPENLLLSNLREVVEALAKEGTPCKFRSAFKDNCPIPGAIWDGCRLLNPDEIIPKDYNLVDSLWDDMWPLSMFLVQLREKYPLMANGVLQCKSTGTTSRAALISSYMSDLRAQPRLEGESVKDYCGRCHPQGFLGSYYELEEMSDTERVAGQVALLGELPNVTILGELGKPIMAIHSLRQGQFDPAGNHVYGDYTTALMLYNEALLSSPARLKPRCHPPPPPPAPEPKCEAECRAEPATPAPHNPYPVHPPPRNECRGCVSRTHVGCPGKHSVVACEHVITKKITRINKQGATP